MTCIRIPNGIVCGEWQARIDLAPFGCRVWVLMHHWCGPLFERKNGDPIDDPTPKMWAAFKKWQESQEVPR